MRRYLFSLAIIISFQQNVLSDVLVVKNNASIQQAIDKAQSGQIIIIEQGEYHEKIAISKPITLKAADNQAVTIRLNTCQNHLINITDCNNVSIIGLNLDGMNEEPGCEDIKNGQSIISIQKSSVTIANCKIINAFGSGIRVLSGSDCNIVGTDCLSNLSCGILAYGENIKLKIQNSRCSKNKANGIYLLEGVDAELRNNDCLNNVNNGISISKCSGKIYLENNNCSNNDSGIYVGEGSKCQATANNLNNNNCQGIFVSGDGTEVTLEKNKCSQNAKNGIYLENNCIATLKENICSKNAWHGISINDGIKYAYLYTNQTVENQRQGIWLENSGALIEPDNIIKNNGYISRWYMGKLFRMEKFDELEEIADQLRKEKKRYKNGNWQLEDFYYLISASIYSPDQFANVAEIESHIDVWLKQYPDSITPRIMLAKAYSNLAWKARGGGWRSDVTEQGWKDMEKYNALAVKEVKKALALNIDEPELYNIYQTLSLNAEEFRENSEQMFKKAIEIYPDYWPLYTSRANFLLPRWHGTRGDLVKLAQSIEAQDPNCEIYALIAKAAVWPIYENLPDDILDIGFAYEKIKTGLESLIKKWPDNDSFKKTLCVYACVFVDKETAKKLFNELGESKFSWQNDNYTEKLRRWATGDSEYPLFKKERTNAEIKKTELEDKLRLAHSITFTIIVASAVLIAMVICICLFAALNIKAGKLRYASLVPLLAASAVIIYVMVDNFDSTNKRFVIVLAGFLIWNMLPMVLWAIVTSLVKKNIKIARTLMLNNILLAAVTIFAVIDSMYISTTSTSALIFIFLPIYTIAGSLITFAMIHFMQILIVKAISPGRNK